ncbi:MAG: Uma2 family endonuclease [Armatimonadota bacterium]
MPAILNDPVSIERLLQERVLTGASRWDELWDGVWHMSPAPSLEHQRIEGELFVLLREAVTLRGIGKVFHEVNVAHPAKPAQDFRIPDLCVVLGSNQNAQLHENYILGAPDLVVEIHSPGDETYAKLDWYAQIGVKEILVIQRDSKAVEQYMPDSRGLLRRSTEEGQVSLVTVPLDIECIHEGAGVQIRIRCRQTGSTWSI